MDTRMFWIHALTPLHVGSGQGVGFIDLPIMREKTTNWPLVPGSAIKGVLADHHKATEDARRNGSKLGVAFGTGGEESANSGALVFTDARIVCLPVRSLYGTFAWVTCPLALTRLRRDLMSDGTGVGLSEPQSNDDQTLLVPDLSTSVLKDPENRVFFEDLDFTAVESDVVGTWADTIAKRVFPDDQQWQKHFRHRFTVAPDDSFSFLSELGTEVNARVKIDDETKTVSQGQLWYEESLPTESILAGIVWCDWVLPKSTFTAQNLMGDFCSGTRLLQMGGKATTGKGRVRCVFDQGGGSNG
jgi:CRISPR-associated protein Cmr4